ncbi:MAG: hypothetical protein PHC85_01800 [Candidatus Pacebacteria bacterium]|nr:hypothetical protein [Candidatus Paceibacterota bacterium]
MSRVGKTNKSYSKRLKITKTGKVLQRGPGMGHFNAKESRSKQLPRKKLKSFNIGSKKNMKHYLPFS